VNKANKPIFCQPRNNEIWVLILEKAWAKANGSYANINSGMPT
jgi:calpain-15